MSPDARTETTSDTKLHLGPTHAREQLAAMLRIRHFESRCAELYTEERIRGFLHLYDGEEGIAVGVAAALDGEDRVVATYREHGHALARGVPMESVFAELLGLSNGCSGGRGGSMHLFDRERRFYGGNAIVAGGLPLAAGLALADRMRADSHVTCCFFGEGAVAEGEFHEAMNLASLWRLPVLFICENNGYAMGTALDISEAGTDVAAKAAAYAMHGEALDGMDVIAVESAARRARRHIIERGEPYLLECRTYRFRAHSMFDAQLYRSKEEIEQWRAKGPIRRLRGWLEESELLGAGAFADLERSVAADVEAALERAERGTPEPVETLTRFVTAMRSTAAPSTDNTSAFPSSSDRLQTVQTAPDGSPPLRAVDEADAVDSSYREAIRAAIVEAMETDERVFLMGEDVGHYGGCYAVSKGLLERFGAERIRDTPLSESGFTGAGIGAAVAGMRPIVEIMTVNFSLLALDQIVNTAATLRHMSNDAFGVPLVIRMATGAGRQLAAQHSHSLEAWYAHVPGLRVLAPATLEDARGMLATALADPDPVLIFEHVMLYNESGVLAHDAGAVDIERAAVRRSGTDLSIVTHGGSLHKALAAAEQLAADDIEAEVVDLRVLRPLDMATILASISRTHRLLVVDEGWCTAGLSAEIGMRVASEAFFELDAAPARVCGVEVPIPYPAHLEQAALPQVDTIVQVATKLVRGTNGDG